MSGYFEKAPLVYVAAVLRTTPLPPLTPDQWLAIGQVLFRCGLPHAIECPVNEVDLSGALLASATPSSATISQLLRRGFFSADRTEALIFDKAAIEWRTTQNLKYSNIGERFDLLLEAVCKSNDLFGLVNVEEITLSYADVIVPFQGRELSDYFEKGSGILPINLLTDNVPGDLQRVAQIQLTRVVAPNEKVHMSLEQLPLIAGKVTKYLPEILTEPHVVFGQPISIKPEWDYPGISEQQYYALLTTQASVLNSYELNSFKFASSAKSLHTLVNNEFKGIINKDVCDNDWGYVEEKGNV